MTVLSQGQTLQQVHACKEGTSLVTRSQGALAWIWEGALHPVEAFKLDFSSLDFFDFLLCALLSDWCS